MPTAVDPKGRIIGKVRLKPLKKRIELPSLKLPDGTVNAPCGSDPECARVVAVVVKGVPLPLLPLPLPLPSSRLS